jgi:CP family cyanate transporter-like MFS transporter
VVAWRTPDAAASASTSGLALGVGYTVAGLGPLGMGLLVDLGGGYPAAIAVLLVAAAAQAFAVVRIVRPAFGRAGPGRSSRSGSATVRQL